MKENFNKDMDIENDDNVKGALGSLDSFATTTPIPTTVNVYLYIMIFAK
jgi:hypothetical protein